MPPRPANVGMQGAPPPSASPPEPTLPSAHLKKAAACPRGSGKILCPPDTPPRSVRIDAVGSSLFGCLSCSRQNPAALFVGASPRTAAPWITFGGLATFRRTHEQSSSVIGWQTPSSPSSLLRAPCGYAVRVVPLATLGGCTSRPYSRVLDADLGSAAGLARDFHASRLLPESQARVDPVPPHLCAAQHGGKHAMVRSCVLACSKTPKRDIRRKLSGIEPSCLWFAFSATDHPGLSCPARPMAPRRRGMDGISFASANQLPANCRRGVRARRGGPASGPTLFPGRTWRNRHRPLVITEPRGRARPDTSNRGTGAAGQLRASIQAPP